MTIPRGFYLTPEGLQASMTLDEILDWSFEWAKKYLPTGDTISTSVWSDDSGGKISLINPVNSSGVTSIFIDPLAGAVIGEKYIVTNTITTTAGRTGVWSFTLTMVSKKP